jgi:predicted O-linked N-acetylglucosamine transferase (SPINDLY family)
MNPQFQLLLQQAIQAFQSGNLESADLSLRRVLQADSKNLPALHILGLIRASQSNYREASDYLARAARIHPNDASIQYNLAKALSDSGNDKDAVAHHKKAVALAPNNPEAWLSYGNTASNLGRYEDALVWYGNALNLNPKYAEAALNKGASLKQLKRYEEAIIFAEHALAINPNLYEAWLNKSDALQRLKRYDDAIACYDNVLRLKPDHHEVWVNKGVTLNELKRYEEAIACYDKALNLKSDYAEGWGNKGVALKGLKRYDEAIACYDNALNLKSDYATGGLSKGNVFYELKRYDEAIAYYNKALSLKPDYAEAWTNKGVTLNELKRYDEAIACYNKALSLKPDYAEAWTNKGVTLSELKRYDEAIAHFVKALSLKPDIDWIYGHLLHVKMKVCSWLGLVETSKTIAHKVLAKERVATPFTLLAMSDDALLHKKSAEIFVNDKYPFNFSLGSIPKKSKNKKICIGYFSADFRDHPVSVLTAGLYEIHDRNQFEVIAFSLQRAHENDEVNLRLRKGFDKFIDAESMSDQEIAKLARELGVDIAIDLTGFTQYSRAGIFSYRTAPIQVNWLGYPGTLGAEFIDYIVADKTIIPESHQQFYAEKIAYLPDTYMVDDPMRVASSRVFSKQECGLPEDVFIFCCFNNGYKFNPIVLDSWSRILLAVDNSVLWISENNEHFQSNIKTEFEIRGIDFRRIIFAKRMELMADHLARYSLADLFLDTYPYNAHTTAVDALKVGVPILTLMGQSFAGRVAASLLNAIGLPELITFTQKEYEALAIELATNPKKLADIKLKLARNRLNTPLFDTPLFTKNLEAAYIKMMEQYQADLQLDHIAIV